MSRALRLMLCLPILLAFALAACGEDATGPGQTDPTREVEGAITPTFELGQTWVVGTIYRQATIRLPENALGLVNEVETAAIEEFSPYIPEAVRPEPDELWSEVIYWRFGVINTDYIPDEGTSFYELALDQAGNVQPITIIKAIAPKEFNGEAISEQLDPVFYLILRESDFRVRGIHFNYRVSGGRNTVVLEMPENTTGNPAPGADLDYFLVDYFMPVFPLDSRESHVVAYGNQTEREAMTVSSLATGAVEVAFTSAMDLGQVRQRWDADEPWFTYSATDARISWLASATELADLMESNGVEYLTNEAFLEPAEAIARKFRNRINLGSNLRIEVGSFSRSAPTTHLPWAGDFWPTSRGALVMGFTGRDRNIAEDSPTRLAMMTVETEAGVILNEEKRSLDRLLEELRNVDQDAEDFDRSAFRERVQDYYDRLYAVSDLLHEFFENPETGFIAQLRAGEIDLSDVNNWSPYDKWGLYLFSQGVRRPFEAAIWEAATQYHPGGAGWWGKCNGWSAAAILYDEPREDITVNLDLASITGGEGALNLMFQTADLKGFLSASNYSGYSQFYGERYNDEKDDLADLHPAVFHRLITYYIGTEHYALVFDTTATEQVWNIPAYKYNMEITEGEMNEADNCQVYHVEVDLRFSTDSVSEDHIDGADREPQGFWKNYTYDLCARNGVVQGDGTWTGSSVNNHPDFAWVPYQNDRRNASAHVNASNNTILNLYRGRYAPNENPFLYTDRMHNLVGLRVNAPQVCNPEPNDCPNDMLCTVETGECREREAGEDPHPDCDGGETREVAAAASAGTLTDQSVCAGTDSWYAFDLTAGQSLTVTVSFTHSDGDIDISLHDPSGQEVGRSTSTSDREEVSVDNASTGKYLLRVYGYNQASNTVTIVTEIGEGGGGEQPTCDGREDEPNDTVDNATAIAESVLDRRAGICSDTDADYYKIDISGSYSALIEFSHEAGDLDMQLLSLDDQTELDRSAGMTDSEEVDGEGPAILRVYGWNGAMGDYRLSVTVD